MDEEVSRYKQRMRLRMLWKYWKTGKWYLVESTVTAEERALLQKYYGVDFI